MRDNFKFAFPKLSPILCKKAPKLSCATDNYITVLYQVLCSEEYKAQLNTKQSALIYKFLEYYKGFVSKKQTGAFSVCDKFSLFTDLKALDTLIQIVLIARNILIAQTIKEEDILKNKEKQYQFLESAPNIIGLVYFLLAYAQNNLNELPYGNLLADTFYDDIECILNNISAGFYTGFYKKNSVLCEIFEKTLELAPNVDLKIGGELKPLATQQDFNLLSMAIERSIYKVKYCCATHQRVKVAIVLGEQQSQETLCLTLLAKCTERDQEKIKRLRNNLDKINHFREKFFEHMKNKEKGTPFEDLDINITISRTTPPLEAGQSLTEESKKFPSNGGDAFLTRAKNEALEKAQQLKLTLEQELAGLKETYANLNAKDFEDKNSEKDTVYNQQHAELKQKAQDLETHIATLKEEIARLKLGHEANKKSPIKKLEDLIQKKCQLEKNQKTLESTLEDLKKVKDIKIATLCEPGKIAELKTKKQKQIQLELKHKEQLLEIQSQLKKAKEKEKLIEKSVEALKKEPKKALKKLHQDFRNATLENTRLHSALYNLRKKVESLETEKAKLGFQLGLEDADARRDEKGFMKIYEQLTQRPSSRFMPPGMLPPPVVYNVPPHAQGPVYPTAPPPQLGTPFSSPHPLGDPLASYRRYP